MSNFKERLNEMIFYSKKSVGEIATDLNISKPTIYRYLNAHRTPKLNLLILLADYFNCSIDYLVGRTDNNHFYNKTEINFSISLQNTLQSFNYTRYKLSKESGINESVILWWIKGDRKPTLDSLIKIANTLDCSIDLLLGRE